MIAWCLNAYFVRVYKEVLIHDNMCYNVHTNLLSWNNSVMVKTNLKTEDASQLLS